MPNLIQKNKLLKVKFQTEKPAAETKEPASETKEPAAETEPKE